MSLHLRDFYGDLTLDLARAPGFQNVEHNDSIYERSPVIEAGVFDPLYNTLEREYRQFQIYDRDREKTIVDEQVDSDYLDLKDKGIELPTDTHLTFRVRDLIQPSHRGDYTSPWQEIHVKTVPFETGEPETPEGEILGTGEYLQGPEYQALGEHIASEFEIRRKSDETLVYSTSKDGDSLQSLLLPVEDLESGTNYQWRVRYESSEQGWLEWSDWVVFTSAHMEKPSASSPSGDEFINLGQSLYGSSPSVTSGELNHTQTQWQIFVRNASEPIWTDTNDSRSITPSFEEFNENEEFEWRVRYHDSVWGWSQWSDRSQFKIPLVKPPEPVSPADGEEGFEEEDIELEVEDLELVGDSPDPDEIEWELYNKDTGEKVWSKTEEF